MGLQNCDHHSKAQIFCKSFVILFWARNLTDYLQILSPRPLFFGKETTTFELYSFSPVR